ncbi:hypothetical protein QA612_17895 [Evansella sp. AB-P1]|uniref:hypothetical protein n=1 Tax=Evansella sp. AB-P1 TaxID=3037653 RepID=UPI00241DBD2B|nr:hypothetical protein [Evansella sp. AB-P1]MDG5789337.1 hypothetical protein [Evansella sp. AB-P1]
MDNQRKERIIGLLKKLQHSIDKKVANKLALSKCERMIKKMDEFSTECEGCNLQLSALEDHLKDISQKQKGNQLYEEDIVQHKRKVNDMISHLRKQHKLVAEGHYLSTYMALGTSLGLVFGIAVFDNVGMGLPIGIAIGLAIGSGLDGDAKKKGKTI